MYCGKCGKELQTTDIVCSNCGEPTKLKKEKVRKTRLITVLAIIFSLAFAFITFSAIGYFTKKSYENVYIGDLVANYNKAIQECNNRRFKAQYCENIVSYKTSADPSYTNSEDFFTDEFSIYENDSYNYSHLYFHDDFRGLLYKNDNSGDIYGYSYDDIVEEFGSENADYIEEFGYIYMVPDIDDDTFNNKLQNGNATQGKISKEAFLSRYEFLLYYIIYDGKYYAVYHRESDSIINDLKDDSKVVYISADYQEDDDTVLIISGMNNAGNALWQYKTQIGRFDQNLAYNDHELTECVGCLRTNDTVYVNNYSSNSEFVALDYQTGQELWRLDEGFDGLDALYYIDDSRKTGTSFGRKNGIIYIGGAHCNPSCVAINSNGNILWTHNDERITGYAYVSGAESSIQIKEDGIHIRYSAGFETNYDSSSGSLSFNEIQGEEILDFNGNSIYTDGFAKEYIDDYWSN